jgi:Rieske Fe-S protein
VSKTVQLSREENKEHRARQAAEQRRQCGRARAHVQKLYLTWGDRQPPFRGVIEIEISGKYGSLRTFPWVKNDSVMKTVSRRRFVRTFALGTAFSAVLGKSWRTPVLAEGIPLMGGQSATFKIRVSDYPALAQAFGSVRLGVNPVRPEEEPFPDGDFWPFLVNRGSNMEFYVLDSECMHASCVVPAYDDFNFGIQCPCHGSTYGIDGSVFTGPSELPLRRYPFVYDGEDTLTITIPGLGFSVQAAVMGAPAGTRLQLNFPTHFGITYQVHYRARMEDDWAVIPFATSLDGPASESAFTAVGLPGALFVDRTGSTGYYAVSMLLAEV